ncbi:DUF1661 domain-containing protein [Porphyromonas gingivalis]|uniref:DUF1661 domain-containing protein n=1 Tax=Porphyromonas gingivalis TaxID=837 RepID=A0AAE9X8I6_PORGN|nr:DUF1661 domain-containing protein [Porphyromonas gingivalis]MDH7903752.1 DUF1661 domain-containing protein [Porphyromonas gingivalis]WCG00106.1 DUF1661 domain-containing protein [Porphyromonas gingivalis]WIM92376.1 DUF1661 domain-containing protein [Porphyromonas gingivalis]
MKNLRTTTKKISFRFLGKHRPQSADFWLEVGRRSDHRSEADASVYMSQGMYL